jgi:hypothetical protein
MSAVREAVRALGGEIEVTSIDGAGTRLTCGFPPISLDVRDFAAKPRRKQVAVRPDRARQFRGSTHQGGPASERRPTAPPPPRRGNGLV